MSLNDQYQAIRHKNCFNSSYRLIAIMYHTINDFEFMFVSCSTVCLCVGLSPKQNGELFNN